MRMDFKLLEKLTAYAKKNGIREIKFGEVEIKFDTNPQPIPQSKKPSAKPVKGDTIDISADLEEMPSDDEMLFRSTSYYDELKAQRKQALRAPK